MRKNVLIAIAVLLSTTLHAQVTKISSNTNLDVENAVPIAGTKLILPSKTDGTVWVTDGTPAGTKQLSAAIKFTDTAGVLNGKVIFSGWSAGVGRELFITDGTAAGTVLLKDINVAADSSSPGPTFAPLNGFLYFTAVTATEGRELWRTDGTTAGTTLVKDIIPGAESSNNAGGYDLTSSGSYLLFSAKTTAADNLGTELYVSDGSNAGTVVLKDINPGTPSSNATFFTRFNNMVLFIATDATHGTEVWKTDGTPSGTQLLKDIKAGTGSSVSNGFFTFFLVYVFNGRGYFVADDGTSGSELWSTDGTTQNTTLLKDIEPGAVGSMQLFLGGQTVGNKFLFPAFTSASGNELWESDGTSEGTKLFKDINPGTEGSDPFFFSTASYDLNNGNVTYPLFQGNKFFLGATTPEKGYELYISDGTAAGTSMVKDINPNQADGLTFSSFIYTSSALYFTGDDGVHGEELWKSDGTSGGTSMVANINSNVNIENQDQNSDVTFYFTFINNKAIFSATDGDVPNTNDLFVLDGSLAPLPVKLGDFTVTPKNADALLQWTTLSEINSRDFTIQRSDNGTSFTNIGTVAAAGTSATKRNYQFTDRDVMNSGKDIVYYRLITTDKDGKSEASKAISLKLKGGEWNIKLTSNLVTSDLDVVLQGVKQNVKISIRDMTGKTVGSIISAAANGHMVVSTNQLSPGMYLLLAETNDERKIIRFVKQ